MLLLQSGTLGAVVLYGAKILRVFNRIEFRVDLMWRDYIDRMRHSHHYNNHGTEPTKGEA